MFVCIFRTRWRTPISCWRRRTSLRRRENATRRRFYGEARLLEERMHAFLSRVQQRRNLLDMSVAFYTHSKEVSLRSNSFFKSAMWIYFLGGGYWVRREARAMAIVTGSKVKNEQDMWCQYYWRPPHPKKKSYWIFVRWWGESRRVGKWKMERRG